MGEVTGIEWADSTANFWIGCRSASTGCARCYARTLVTNRMGRDFNIVQRTKPATFDAPLKWKDGTKVFTCSLSDFFIEDADPWRADAWEIIRRTPNLVWMILTKRPENILDRLPPDWGIGWPNVWLGVSGETRQWVHKRGMILRGVPARVRFLSAEPWLELQDASADVYADLLQSIRCDWLIIGGESGPSCRAMSMSSARSVLAGCDLAGIPAMYKQQGGHPDKRDRERATIDGRTWKAWPK